MDFININFVATCLLAGIGIYLTYYLQQKGKNIADKEDLQKLTTIVEDVKKKNTEEIELLKTNLSLLTSRKIQIFSEEKEAIIAFFSKLNAWLWNNSNPYLPEYNHLNVNELISQIGRLRNDFTEANIAFSKIKILTVNQQLVNNGYEAILDILKFHQLVEISMVNLSKALKQEKIYYDKLEEEISKKTVDKINIPEFLNEMAAKAELTKDRVIKDFLDKNSTLFNTAFNSIERFKDLAKEHLNK